MYMHSVCLLNVKVYMVQHGHRVAFSFRSFEKLQFLSLSYLSARDG